MDKNQFEKKFIKQRKNIQDTYIKGVGKQKMTQEQREELAKQVTGYYKNLYKKTVLEPITKLPKI